jgi:hypothetical protein
VTVRICGAVPYERNEDPDDLPLPSVCFSESLYQECYHYRTMIKRKEIAAQLGLVVPLTVPSGMPELASDIVGADRRMAG